MGLRHAAALLHSQIREHAKSGTGVTHKLAQALTGEPPRSSEWPTIERRWRKAHPDCAACGSTKHVQVHHVESFKTHPELELHDGTDAPPATPPPDGKANFISLCMDKLECHLKIGHGGSFAHGGYNPEVRQHADAALALKKYGPADVSAALQAIWNKAKAARVTE